MKKPWLLVVPLTVALPFLCWGQPASKSEERPAPTAAAEAAVKEIAADLREARELLKKVTDKATHDRLELLLTRAELKTGDVQKHLASLAVMMKPGVAPASAEDFANLMKGLMRESFDDGKAAFVENFAKTRRFTCAQAREILKQFSFDDGRGKAAVALYPRLTDPENFFMALEVFTFESGRKSVKEKLKLK